MSVLAHTFCSSLNCSMTEIHCSGDRGRVFSPTSHFKNLGIGGMR